jgi:hypothetical protein
MRRPPGWPRGRGKVMSLGAAAFRPSPRLVGESPTIRWQASLESETLGQEAPLGEVHQMRRPRVRLMRRRTEPPRPSLLTPEFGVRVTLRKGDRVVRRNAAGVIYITTVTQEDVDSTAILGP